MINNEYVKKVIKDGTLLSEVLEPHLTPRIDNLRNFLDSAVFNEKVTAEQRIEAYSKVLALESVLNYFKELQKELNSGSGFYSNFDDY